ncbi:DUF6629 family protein [Streptomyces lavendofoliae]|uniref:Uncharacterized protein n=1 Tax=Streptomyces lavendofoliae TaxID=67314 RepID=A0A918HWZ1_9ACTN|nr:DUF6629 family protein [Streptomyces lavendofoliae]GGU39488.1 hypothetical protein GCM10010274_28810 [Streptomyces lavendofoliae]
MCWNATADLAAGTVIATVGAVCVVRARNPRELPLAALPLLLGAHQVVEAAVWEAGGGSGPATLAWAVIALPLLPVWVPFGVLLVTPPGRRARLAVPVAAGLATAAALAYRLADGPVTAHIRGRTIGYVLDLPYAPLLIGGYLLATVGALLLAADRALRLLGAVIAAGAALCVLLWRTEFVSTWCAFAAVASLILLARIRRTA